MEKLRQVILKPSLEELKIFPLNVTYLKTVGEHKSVYTSNLVGYTDDKKYAIIFFCDFVIQFFEDIHKTPFHPLCGINDKSTFHKFVNYWEKEFLVKVLSNEQRKAVLNQRFKEKMGPILNALGATFIQLWQSKYKSSPPDEMVQKYSMALVDTNGIPQALWYSEDRIKDFTIDFVNNHPPTSS